MVVLKKKKRVGVMFSPSVRPKKSGFRAMCRQQQRKPGAVGEACMAPACSELTAWIAVIHLCTVARVWLAVYTVCGEHEKFPPSCSHEAWSTVCIYVHVWESVSQRKFRGFFFSTVKSQARTVCTRFFFNDDIVTKTYWFFCFSWFRGHWTRAALMSIFNPTHPAKEKPHQTPGWDWCLWRPQCEAWGSHWGRQPCCFQATGFHWNLRGQSIILFHVGFQS